MNYYKYFPTESEQIEYIYKNVQKKHRSKIRPKIKSYLENEEFLDEKEMVRYPCIERDENLRCSPCDKGSTTHCNNMYRNYKKVCGYVSKRILVKDFFADFNVILFLIPPEQRPGIISRLQTLMNTTLIEMNYYKYLIYIAYLSLLYTNTVNKGAVLIVRNLNVTTTDFYEMINIIDKEFDEDSLNNVYSFKDNVYGYDIMLDNIRYDLSSLSTVLIETNDTFLLNRYIYSIYLHYIKLQYAYLQSQGIISIYKEYGDFTYDTLSYQNVINWILENAYIDCINERLRHHKECVKSCTDSNHFYFLWDTCQTIKLLYEHVLPGQIDETIVHQNQVIEYYMDDVIRITPQLMIDFLQSNYIISISEHAFLSKVPKKIRRFEKRANKGKSPERRTSP